MDSTVRDEDGRTALHHTKGNVLHLLEQGIDPNICDDGGWSPLMSAASSGDLIRVKNLIEFEKTDANLQNESGCTALHYACSKGFVEIVQAMLQKEGINLNVQDNSGKCTPIIRAMLAGHVRIVRMLKDARAKLNSKDVEGNTVLHYAVASENVDLVVELIGAGALDGIKNLNNQTPLDIASVFMRNRLEEEL